MPTRTPSSQVPLVRELELRERYRSLSRSLTPVCLSPSSLLLLLLPVFFSFLSFLPLSWHAPASRSAEGSKRPPTLNRSLGTSSCSLLISTWLYVPSSQIVLPRYVQTTGHTLLRERNLRCGVWGRQTKERRARRIPCACSHGW